MSYIRAKQVTVADGTSIDMITGEVVGQPDLDRNLDDEVLGFVQDLLHRIDELGEGEALVVWKDIF